MHLPAHEREPLPQLPQRVDDPINQRLLELPLLRITIEREEVEDVRVLGDSLRRVRLPCRQRRGEVRRRRFEPAVGVCADVVLEDVSRPPMVRGLRGVPLPGFLVVETVEQHRDVPPWELSNKLLDNFLVRPRGSDPAHVEEVRARSLSSPGTPHGDLRQAGR